MSRYVVHHQGVPIDYHVRPPGKRTRRLAIYVHPSGKVHVVAPTGVGTQEIHRYVESQAGWILKQLNRFRDRAESAEPPGYAAGAQHYYLGERYPLVLIRDLIPGVVISAGELQIYSDDFAPHRIQGMLSGWYAGQADRIFLQRLQHLAPELPWVGETLPPWRHRPMRSQWGSCSARGRISLNTHLVKAPLACIDSVIIHELCHLKHHNHGTAFQRLLQRHTPDVKGARQRLNALAGTILR